MKSVRRAWFSPAVSASNRPLRFDEFDTYPTIYLRICHPRWCRNRWQLRQGGRQIICLPGNTDPSLRRAPYVVQLMTLSHEERCQKERVLVTTDQADADGSQRRGNKSQLYALGCRSHDRVAIYKELRQARGH